MTAQRVTWMMTMSDWPPRVEAFLGAVGCAAITGALVGVYILNERSKALRGPLDRSRAHRPTKRHDGRAKLLGKD